MQKHEKWLAGLAIVLFVATAPLLFVDKGQLSLWVNTRHFPAADLFFKYATWLGDGLVMAVVIPAAALYRYGLALYVGAVGAAHGLVVALGKQGFFKGMPRPKNYFPEGTPLHVPEGVELHGFNTFPSGHSATAFAIGVALALACRHRPWAVALLCLSAIVAFSRVYLLQHFFPDIYVGAAIGALSAFLCWPPFSKLLENREWARKGLLRPKG